MAVLFANNAQGKLSSPVDFTQTTVSVQAGQGSRFPSPSGGDWFPVTVVKAAGELEIMRCTARANDVLTVVRSQDGTTAKEFEAGDRVELRATREVWNGLLQASRNLEDIESAVAARAALDLRAGAISDTTALRTSSSTTTVLQAAGMNNHRTSSDHDDRYYTKSQVNAMVAAAVPSGIIAKWSGSVASIPSGWVLCNGSNGAPDLRGRFIIGAGGTYGPGNTGGAESVTLTTGQIPAHNHSASTGGAGSHNHGGSTGNDGGHSHTTGSNGSHSHSGTANSAGSHDHNLDIYTGSSGDAGGTLRIRGATISNPWTNSSNAMSNSGAHTHSLSINSNGSHNHSVSTVANHSHSISNESNHMHSVSVSNAGGGGSHENRPPYYALAYIMKT